jgi:enoyl-CoA hydratase
MDPLGTAAFTTLQVGIDGHVGQIVLNRPAAHNSVSAEMHVEIKDAFLSMRSAEGVRAIVFAANVKAFSAGGNFDDILADRTDHVHRNAMRAEARELLLAVAESPIPVVTALQGDAVGLGATLIMATDAIIAARTARISDPHVVIGLAAGDGGCVAWPLHMGLLRAKRYLLTGDRLTAEDAFHMGLVTDLVDTADEVLPAARALAARIASLPPLAVQATKRTLNQVFRHRFDQVFEMGLELEMQTFVSEDVVEAIAAFREKRPPRYTGR